MGDRLYPATEPAFQELQQPRPDRPARQRRDRRGLVARHAATPPRTCLGGSRLWEAPSAALEGSAGYALGGLLYLNEYGRFLFAFVLGYLDQAALHDLAVAVLRHRAGLLPADGSAPRGSVPPSATCARCSPTRCARENGQRLPSRQNKPRH
jgi:hypothetical protein